MLKGNNLLIIIMGYKYMIFILVIYLARVVDQPLEIGHPPIQAYRALIATLIARFSPLSLLDNAPLNYPDSIPQQLASPLRTRRLSPPMKCP